MIHSINFISPGPIALSWRPSAGIPFSLSFLFIPVWFRTSRCCCSWTHYTAFQTGALNSWRDSTWSCSHALLCLGSLPAPLSSSTRSHRHKLKHRDTHCMTDWKLRNNFVKASKKCQFTFLQGLFGFLCWQSYTASLLSLFAKARQDHLPPNNSVVTAWDCCAVLEPPLKCWPRSEALDFIPCEYLIHLTAVGASI